MGEYGSKVSFQGRGAYGPHMLFVFFLAEQPLGIRLRRISRSRSVSFMCLCDDSGPRAGRICLLPRIRALTCSKDECPRVRRPGRITRGETPPLCCGEVAERHSRQVVAEADAPPGAVGQATGTCGVKLETGSRSNACLREPREHLECFSALQLCRKASSNRRRYVVLWSPSTSITDLRARWHHRRPAAILESLGPDARHVDGNA